VCVAGVRSGPGVVIPGDGIGELAQMVLPWDGGGDVLSDEAIERARGAALA